MQKFSLLIISCLFFQLSMAQNESWEEAYIKKSATLNVIYHKNMPFAYSDAKGQAAGIEVDIIRYFAEWLQEKKNVNLKLAFKEINNFENFYNEIQSMANNTIGAGTVSITDNRKEEVNFSSPYLKNISVLISDGSIPTAMSMEDVYKNFGGMQAVTLKGSVHEQHILELMKNSKNSRTPVYVESPLSITDKIEESSKYYGYIDIISFWTYVKSNSHYIKMHKVANIENEEFAFIFPKQSDWNLIFNEFFESGFGFTSTKDYHNILARYLGFEVLDKVELE